MDVVICDNNQITKINDTSNAISNYLRYWSISSMNKKLRDINEFIRAYPNINFRYFVMPSQNLVSQFNGLDFMPEVLSPMVEIGKKDAENIIKLGHGQGFKRFIEWQESEIIKKSYPLLSDYIHSFNE
jgi:hypothetical protein